MIEKRAGEKYPVGFRYRDPDLPDGVTITGVAVSCAPSGLTVGSGQYSGAEIWAWVEAGSAGVDYTLTFTTTLSDSKKLIDDFVVKVR
jgi:hypothetical protein